MTKKSLVVAALIVFVTGAAMLLPMSQRSEDEAEVTVVIEGYAYNPKELTVKVGTTVTWVNNDGTEHSATADDESFDTGLVSEGETASVTFSEPGRYDYHCDPHSFMKGTVVVE
ncbi:cupredoxin family copper-binding protein [Acidobacteria bacterium AH-259-A15]|nr:cupredoxin family copper-binding protein [Acidobacteria bacterium AH-259-A15]